MGKMMVCGVIFLGMLSAESVYGQVLIFEMGQSPDPRPSASLGIISFQGKGKIAPGVFLGEFTRDREIIRVGGFARQSDPTST